MTPGEGLGQGEFEKAMTPIHAAMTNWCNRWVISM